MSIITYPLNGITYDADDAQTYLCTRTSGVFNSDECFAITVTDSLTVTIAPGLAWIKNADYAGKSVCVTESVDLEISPGGSLPRTDRVVLRFSKSENASELAILEGTESSSYPAPDVTQEETVYELGLYEIYVAASATSIDADDITDTRNDNSVCGRMTDAVTSVTDLGEYGSDTVPIYITDGEFANCFANGTALGINAEANGQYSVAYGLNASATGGSSTAIGYNAVAYQTSTTAVGGMAQSVGMFSASVGYASRANGNYSVAVGFSTFSGYNSIAIGVNSNAAYSSTIVIGSQSYANNACAMAFGVNANATGNYSIAIGGTSKSSANLAIAIGRYSNATGANSISIGANSNAGFASAVLGAYASAGTNSVAIGKSAVAPNYYCVAIGYAANADYMYDTAIGYNAYAPSMDGTAVGSNANAYASETIAIGTNSESSASGATALGVGAIASANRALALGYNSQASADYSTALGRGSACSNANGIQLGSASYTSSLTCKVSLTTTSDIRDKTDIEEIGDGATEFLKSLKAIRFVFNQRENYIDEENLTDEDREKLSKYGMCSYDTEAYASGTKKGTRIRGGVSAQEVQSALESVYGDNSYTDLVNDNLYDFDADEIPDDVESKLAVNYSGFIPYLIKAIQEIDERVSSLEGTDTAS